MFNLSERTLSLFEGRTSVYAVQHADGTYHPVREPLTEDILDQHLEGTITVGRYLLREDNHVKVLCFDIDRAGQPSSVPLAVAGKLQAALRAATVRTNATCLEFSGNKGYHLWVFLSEWTEPLAVRDFGRRIVASIGEDVEVYPKGDLQGKELGNLVKLPFALHRVSGKNSTLVNDAGEGILPVVLEDIKPLRYREIKDIILAKAPDTKAVEESATFEPDGQLLPCGSHIIEFGQQEGARNHAMYGLAVLCRRAGQDEAEALATCEQANLKFEPELSRWEVRNTVRSAYRSSGTPGFTCTTDFLHQGAEPHCKQTCPRYSPEFGRSRP